jgi:putative endonuclease
MPSSRSSHDDDISRVERGRRFEDLAAKFYIDQGFEILERNWRSGHKEIDLIVRQGDQVCFVEVKASFSSEFGHPIERVNKRKVQNLTECARQYIAGHDLGEVGYRFDVITFDKGKLEHYPDAFSAE